jgi:hypothetical protein
LLGQLPAILAFDRAEQPTQERPDVPADLASGEPGCDPGDERVQFGRPSLDLGQCSFHLPTSLVASQSEQTTAAKCGWSTDVERLVKAMFCLVDGVIRHR